MLEDCCPVSVCIIFTLCGAEGDTPLVRQERRHHLLPGLDLQLPSVTQHKLLLCAAVGQRQQALHQLDETRILGNTHTDVTKHITLCLKSRHLKHSSIESLYFERKSI